MIKSKIRSYLSVLLLITLVITCIAILTGCGDEVEQIYVDNSHAPRLNYVQGQELDLQKGILTAVIGKDGEETLIPMTDERITVEGYDSNTIGSQVVIINYEGKTTSITVNVIPRIVAEGYETGYFTGDKFKSDKGKLKVAKDDATTVMVSMNDPRVSLVSFDSTTAGEKTVKVKYTDTNGSYDCTFNVIVYDAATSDISIVYPKKTGYGSHETELDFTGGYITVKGGINGQLEKHVDITKDMTEGYDHTAVSPINPTVKQTITITYLGKTFQYTINLSYSGVSSISDQMEILKSINLNSSSLELTEAQKTAAWVAISQYYGLKDSDKENISEEDLNVIVRVASIAVSDLYRTELKKYENTIAIVKDQNGNEAITLPAKTYETTLADLAKLKDKDEMINRYATVLRSLLADYPDLIVRGDKKVADEVFVMPQDIQSNLINILSHLTDLYDDILQVPENWTQESLTGVDLITGALNHIRVNILAAPYYKGGQGNIYDILTSWRADFFDIFYTYFLYCDENFDEEAVANMLDKMPWPTKIETWYSYWYNLAYMSTQLKESVSETSPKTFMNDLTQYMYLYKLMTDGATEIRNNQTTDKLTYDLYRLISGDARIQAVRYDLYGFYGLQGFLSDENTLGFSEMWNTYLELVDLYYKGELVASDGKVITTGYEAKYEAVMTKLFELSPAELSEFLSSLNFLYGNTNSEILALSLYTTEVNGTTVSTYLSTLSTLINAYYKITFNETEFDIFEKLLVAMESYSSIGRVANAKETFMTAMKAAIDAYTPLADKTLFDAKLGAGFDAYKALYEACLSENNITVEGDALKHINTIVDASAKFENILDYITTELAKPEEERNIRSEAYMVLFALYEKTRYSYLTLTELAEENESLRLAMYKNLYEIGENKLTVEQIFTKVGNRYWSYMLRMPSIRLTSGGNTYTYKLYDLYINPDFAAFLLYSADILYAQFNESAINGFTENEVNNMIAQYNKLDNVLSGILNMFDVDELYFSFIEDYTAAALATDAETLALANKLIEAARAYQTAQIQPTEENANAFKALMAAAKELKDALTSDENYVKYLKVMYEHYQGIIDSANQPQQ